MANQQTPNFQSMQQSILRENVPEIHFDCSNGSAMQLVRITEGKKFEIVQKTLDHMKEIDGAVALCTILGKYRTGKSFLLNKILELDPKNSFEVSPNVTACTKGLWIWSKPVYNEKDNVNIFFMDTEGLDSVDRDQDVDSKLFALTVLVSSYFIFNSIGSIDENSINTLALITHLIKTVTVEENERVYNEYQLSQYAPKFMWLLRDFVLEIKDVRGRTVTAQQYLESALNDIPPSQNNFGRGNQGASVRQSIINFFKSRDCMTLIRPVHDEKELQNISNLPVNRIRPDFMSHLHVLRDKIYKNCNAKIINGVALNSNMLGSLLGNFTESFNKGKAPSIQTTWKAFLENECVENFELAMASYDKEVDELISSKKSYRNIDIYKMLSDLRDTSLGFYSRCSYIDARCPGIYDQYKARLHQHIQEQEKKVLAHNTMLAHSNNIDFLNSKTMDFIRSVRSEGKTEENAVEEFDRTVLKSYSINHLGGDPSIDLIKGINGISLNVIDWYSKGIDSSRVKRRNQSSRKQNVEAEKLTNDLEDLRYKEERLRGLEAEIDNLNKKTLGLEKSEGRVKLDGLVRRGEELTNRLRLLDVEKSKNSIELERLMNETKALEKKKGGCF